MKREPAVKASIHVWAPDIIGYAGGLQKHLYSICLAVQDLLKGGRVKIISKSNTVSFIFALKILLRYLLDRPDLIIVGHVHFCPVAYMIKRLFKTPFWIVAYGIESWDIQNDSIRKSLLASNRILSMSSFTKNRIAGEQNIKADKISVLPGTFDANLFKIKPKPGQLLDKYGLNGKQPVILTVCRLDKGEKYKGYDRIIEALPRLIQYFPDIRYVLVGEGSDTERIEELVSSLKLDKHVILPGKITGEDLCDHYNLCDCFAMPSTGEGFGIVFLEALACGKPVLAGNKDGSVDALRNGELGVLVDPDEINDISDNLIKILKREHPNKTIYDPQLLRAKAIEYFGFDKFRMTLEQYLKDAKTLY